jgi:hypothetical protein
MPYTAATLADFMVTELDATGVALGLTDASPAIVEAVNEVAAILDVADVATLTDDLKTRAIARWQAWLAAEAAATNQYDLKAGTVDLTRSQWFAQIGVRLARAEASAARYEEVAAIVSGAAGVATVSEMATAGSPYVRRYDEWA